MSKKERTLANLVDGGIVRCVHSISVFKEDLLYKVKDKSGKLVTNYDPMKDLILVTQYGDECSVGGVLISRYFEPYEFQVGDLVVIEEPFKNIEVSSGKLLDQDYYNAKGVDITGGITLEDKEGNLYYANKASLSHYEGTKKSLSEHEYYEELARLYNNLAISLKTSRDTEIKIKHTRKSIAEHLNK